MAMDQPRMQDYLFIRVCALPMNNDFPIPILIPDDDKDILYFPVRDGEFQLRTCIMKTYGPRGLTNEERVFNYRLSRARRVVENAFGIIAHRWRCLLNAIQLEP